MTSSTDSVPAADPAARLDGALARPARDGARLVALHWLHDLREARDSWRAARAATDIASDDPSEPAAPPPDSADALHKARVALRRLRATLREHRKSLGLNEGRRARRALRRLNAATGDARDQDVQREWLASQRDRLPTDVCAEADQLLTLIDAGQAKRYDGVTRAFERHLDPRAARLSRRLGHYTVDVTADADAPVGRFAESLATRLEEGLDAIRRDLDASTAIDDQTTLHRLRIRLKQQRAMLAPFAHLHPAITAWYAMATEGQDQLGAMRDAMLLADRAQRRECAALATTLRMDAVAHFEAFHARWSADPGAVVIVSTAAVDAVRRWLPAERAPEPPPELELIHGLTLPNGHGLPMEIERKFLLHGLPPHAAMAPSLRIEQGWLPGTVLRERLRRSVAANGSVRHSRTIKLGQPGARIEVEEPVEPSLFYAMWPYTIDARIRKRRHVVVDGALTWEVDVFLDRDLVIAEVELQDTAQSIELPSWLAPFVIREVTHDPAYLNSVMAQRDVASPDRDAR